MSFQRLSKSKSFFPPLQIFLLAPSDVTLDQAALQLICQHASRPFSIFHSSTIDAPASVAYAPGF